MFRMITPEKALEVILERASPLQTVTVDLWSANGMAAAEPVVAPVSLPPFDKSPLDGYALRAADTREASANSPVSFRLLERIYAGELSRQKVGPGTAIAVTTGTAVPPGADCVVRQEDTVLEGERVYVKSRLRSGENIIRAGEDVTRGERAVEIGQKIDGRLVGLLGALGRDEIKVFRRPRVAVFSTGNEFLEFGQPPEAGKIYRSNPYALGACIKEMGAEVRLLDNVPDNPDLVAARIEEGIAVADLVVSTGGMSMGARDVVREAVVGAGAELVCWQAGFNRVACAQKDGCLILNLSGNPSSAWIAFIVLVRPVLLRLAGFREIFPGRVKGVMAEPYTKASKQRRFVMARVAWEKDRYLVRLSGRQGQASLRSLASCNALIDIPAGHGPLAPGENVNLLLLPAVS